jgi:hypothetical protein
MLEGASPGVGPTVRHGDHFGAGSPALERLGLIMPSDILKAGAVGNPELIKMARTHAGDRNAAL